MDNDQVQQVLASAPGVVLLLVPGGVALGAIVLLITWLRRRPPGSP